jgi:hypothetical protein
MSQEEFENTGGRAGYKRIKSLLSLKTVAINTLAYSHRASEFCSQSFSASWCLCAHLPFGLYPLFILARRFGEAHT